MMSTQVRGVSSGRSEPPRCSSGVAGPLARRGWLSGASAHDDVVFVALQTHELWFNQLLCELAVLVGDLDADRLPVASRTLERAAHIAAGLLTPMRGFEALPGPSRGRLGELLGGGTWPDAAALERLERLVGTGATPVGRWLARERRPERPRSACVREAFVRAVAREPGGEAPPPGGGELRAWLGARLTRPALASQRELAAGLRALDEHLVGWSEARRQLAARLGAARPRPGATRPFFPELWPELARHGRRAG